MKTLYFDCGMGAAGDMLTAALLELLPDPDGFIEELNALGIPGVKYYKEPSVKCGITGTHVKVTVDGVEEESHEHHDHEGHEHHHDHEECHERHHDHHHDHDHEGHGHHHHASLHDIEHIVKDHLNLPAKVAKDVMAVYGLIAEAESHAHGVPVTEIHFHEVGTMDAIADVTAVSLLMHKLAPEKVVVSPVHVGSGQVHCAHGILPVPAPATAYILKNAPIYGGAIRGELCTPTGAALLKHFATEFGSMPAMRVQSIGYGMGKKDFEAANCVRVMLGETVETVSSGNDDATAKKPGDERIFELSCNVDDMTGEEMGFALERLFEIGVRDAYVVPIYMKKNRPGHLFRVLCTERERERTVKALFKFTRTIGIRECELTRYVLDREFDQIDSPYGTVHRKVSEGYGVTREKLEYDDLAAIARKMGLSLWEVKKLIEKE